MEEGEANEPEEPKPEELEEDPFYFVNLPAEEPSEPEIVEASPYLP